MQNMLGDDDFHLQAFLCCMVLIEEYFMKVSLGIQHLESVVAGPRHGKLKLCPLRRLQTKGRQVKGSRTRRNETHFGPGGDEIHFCWP